MAGNRKAREYQVKRCYQCSRQEEELWNLAYDQIWPWIRESLAREQAEQQRVRQAKSTTMAKGA